MRNIIYLTAIAIIVGHIFFWGGAFFAEKQYALQNVTLDVFRADVNVEYVETLGENKAGQYDPSTRTISIVCPKDGRYGHLYGTIAHEAVHYALDMAHRRKIEDEETVAYMVGYVTEQAIKKYDCEE